MDLGARKIFLAVAHERSFSRAAAKVHRTQPAVSQAVRRLEDDLGEQLFDRSSKSFRRPTSCASLMGRRRTGSKLERSPLPLTRFCPRATAWESV